MKHTRKTKIVLKTAGAATGQDYQREESKN